MVRVFQDLRRRAPREGQEVRREGGREGDMLRELGGRRLKHGTGQVHAPKETGSVRGNDSSVFFWARECGKIREKIGELRKETGLENRSTRQEMAQLTPDVVDCSSNVRFPQKKAS